MKQIHILWFALFTFVACEKEENNDQTGNPTNGKTTAVFNPNLTYGTMTDQDGNIYKTITIGFQTWMAENLRTTKYNDGKAIHNIKDNDEWKTISSGAYCNYNNTISNDTIATYGRLYNWHAVNTTKLCPSNWHIPTESEWLELTDYLGEQKISGGKMKEAGTLHWKSPNNGATNESGFTGFPSGFRFDDRGYYGISTDAVWWSATEDNIYTAWFQGLYYRDTASYTGTNNKYFGFSIRCIKD